MIQEFKLPELGENIHSADVIQVLVSPGNKVEVDQSVLEIETDKATIEVPSTIAGTVKEVMIKAGEKAGPGQVIFTVETDAAAAGETKAEAEKIPEVKAPEIPKEDEKRTEEKLQSAEKEETVVQPQDVQQPEESKRPEPAAQAETAPPQKKPKVYIEDRKLTDPSTLAPAAPTVRRFAREIGVDINQVKGSGPGGRISIPDVKEYARKKSGAAGPVSGGAAVAAGGVSIAAESLPDFSKWGEIEKKEMSNIRRKTAEHLSYAWATIPHVTQFDKADITELEKLRKLYAPQAEKKGGKLTVTAILLKIVAAALKEFPQFNTSVDMLNSAVIYKKFFNVGVAVDTDRGLLVPVMRDVDKKSILDLAAELNQVAEKARNKKLSLEDMQGACFTITNLGGIGGTYFTPIVNSPEVAILGVSRGSFEQVYIDGKFEARMMLPLSLSYDHRIIDGADGARFLRWVVNMIEHPFMMALQ